MKIKLLTVIFAIAALSTIGLAQSVVITAKKVTYKRSKPMSEYKKSFTIRYPKVRASSPALSQKIETSISYQKVLGLKLNEELRGGEWLEEADYEVGFNKNGVLCVRLWMDGSGAYPSGTSKYAVVDLKTGLRAKPSDAFTNVPGLLRLVRKAKDEEVTHAIAELKKDPENKDINPEDMFKEHDQYNPLTLNDFEVTNTGVTFHHDYGFPHVIQALQPDGEFKFTWTQLRSFIQPGGLLSRIER